LDRQALQDDPANEAALMRLGLLSRVGAAASFAAAIVLSCLPAGSAPYGPAQLSGVAVVPTRKGAVRVALSFVQGVPRGWTITGSGTQTPTVILPGTSQAPTLNQLAYAGAGGVSSVSLSSTGTGLAVTLHLTSALEVTSSANGSTILIDVASAAANPTVTPAPDSALNAGNGPQNFEVVQLKYADVGEVVDLLVQGQTVTSDVFQPEGSIFSLPTSSNGIPTQSSSPFSPSLTSQPTALGERVNDSVGYDRRLNAIILYGTPEQIAQYKTFIAAVDIPVPSVMLECAVLELDETAAKNLGIDYTNPAGALASGNASLGPTGNSSLGGFSAPNLTATLQANLYLTITHGGGKILATPRVLALNGVPAQILSGDALPIAQTTTIPSGNSYLTQSTINYIAVGINMQIQPRIDPGGFVTSHIFAEASSVTQYVNTGGQSVPQVSLRQVTTEATVKDGQPYILGGLLLDEEIDSLSKIPGIGDLPLIGGFFRVRHTTTQRTNLYIIITPHIIRQIGTSDEAVPKLPPMEVPGPMPSYPPPSPNP
jgi:general secretion pathway protein D